MVKPCIKGHVINLEQPKTRVLENSNETATEHLIYSCY